MARLTICTKSFFAPIVRRYLGGLLAAGRSTSHCFFRRRRRTHRIEAASNEIPRVTAEVRTAEEDRQSVNRNKPDRERLSADARFAFFPLYSCVHLLDVGLFAVIHSLAC